MAFVTEPTHTQPAMLCRRFHRIQLLNTTQQVVGGLAGVDAGAIVLRKLNIITNAAGVHKLY